MKVDKVITEDEAALYDRQIRLWGVDAQKKLLSSRILLVNIQGLGAEIAKNLVLSGINCLTLLDSNEVTSEDLRSNFLLSQSSIGKNRAESCVDSLQNLNPMVKVGADSGKLDEKDQEYFSTKNFDLVCVLGNDLVQLERINTICRANNVLFISGYVYGLYGYMFVDFNDFQFIAEAPKITNEDAEKKKTGGAGCELPKQNEQKLTLEEKNLKFKSFSEFLSTYGSPVENLSANKLKRLSKTYFLILLLNNFYQTYQRPFSTNIEGDLDNLIKLKKKIFEERKFNDDLLSDSYLAEHDLGELSPVNAILGGVIGQEVIKAISKKNEPIDNLFVFDGNQMSGEVIKI